MSLFARFGRPLRLECAIFASHQHADVAELVDAHGSGPCLGNQVEVRVLSSASCDVSGHAARMCRDIVDSLGTRHRLVDAAGVERKLADRLAVCVDHPHLIGSSLCGCCALGVAFGRCVATAPSGKAVGPCARTRPDSAVAVHGYVEGDADLTHPFIAEPAETLNEGRDRDALYRVEVYRRPPRNWIVTRLHHDLAGKTPDRRRAGRDERSPQPRNGRVTRQHDDRPPTDLRQLAPPHLSARRKSARAHDSAAASRNDARSPQASGSVSGCSSYAA